MNWENCTPNRQSLPFSNPNSNDIRSSKVLTSTGKIKNINLENINIDSNPDLYCKRCTTTKDELTKVIKYIRKYVDIVNERINLIYHKTSCTSNIGSANLKMDMNFACSLDYYHSTHYADLEKFDLEAEVVGQFRNLMKSIGLFNDKVEYVHKKCENFEHLIQEYKKNHKFINDKDTKNFPVIPELDINEVKSMDIQTIFKNFNNAKDSIESNLKELKSNISGHDKLTTENIKNNDDLNDLYNFEALNEFKHSDTFLRNELARLIKENTSLRLELNYIYTQLREDEKIYEIRDEKFVVKQVVSRDINATITSSSPTTNKRLSNHYSTGSLNLMNNITTPSAKQGAHKFANPIIVFNVKNEKKDEKWIVAKNYLKALKLSEFYMI